MEEIYKKIQHYIFEKHEHLCYFEGVKTKRTDSFLLSIPFIDFIEKQFKEEGLDIDKINETLREVN